MIDSTANQPVALVDVGADICELEEQLELIEDADVCRRNVDQEYDQAFEQWMLQGLAAKIARLKGHTELAEQITRQSWGGVTTWRRSDKRRVAMLVSEARMAMIQRQTAKAIDLYEQALEICESIQEFDATLACDVIEELAELYFMTGDIKQSISLFKTAFEIDDAELKAKGTLRIHRLLKIVKTYQEMGRLEDAARCEVKARDMVASPIEQLWVRLAERMAKKNKLA